MRHGVSRMYPVNANWKVYVDNFLEGYHIPLVHPALNREIDYRSYETVLRTRHVVQSAAVREQGTAHFRAQPGEPPASYLWLYPNMMLNLYQGQLQTNVVIPRGVDRCDVQFDWYAPETLAATCAGASWCDSATRSRRRTPQSASVCTTTCARAPIDRAPTRRGARVACIISTASAERAQIGSVLICPYNDAPLGRKVRE